MRAIDSKVQHLFEARTMEDVMKRSKARQIELANDGKNNHCNVAKYLHWYNKTVSMAAEVTFGGKKTYLVITSNN